MRSNGPQTLFSRRLGPLLTVLLLGCPEAPTSRIDSGTPLGDPGLMPGALPHVAMDAGVMDAGVLDAGVMDAGVLDAGVMDAGVMDAGVMDAGRADGGLMCGPGSVPSATGCMRCPPGTFCPAGSQSIQPCVDSFDDDGNPSTACRPWADCLAGSFVVTNGTATSNRVCSTCPATQFTSTPNASSCSPWRTCAPGTFVGAPGTASSDRVCTACAAGTFSDTANAMSCALFRSCLPGTFVGAEGTVASDRVCNACAAGAFSATANAVSCRTWTTCSAGTSVASAGTAVADRTCSPCAPGTFSSSANAASCSAWTSCGAGTFVAAAGSSTVDRLCTACAASTFSTTANAASCSPWRTCSPGTFVSTAGTPSADRTCTACVSGSWASTSNASSCTPWTACVPGTFVSTQGTTVADQGCAACASGTFTELANRASCAPWSVCLAPEIELRAGTASRDRGCGPGSWTRQFSLAPDAWAGSDIAVTQSGVVVVGGVSSSCSSCGSYSYVSFSDFSGNQLFSRPSVLESAFGVAPFSQGGFVVISTRSRPPIVPPGPPPPAPGIIVRRYDQNGTLLWASRPSNSVNEEARAVAVSPAGTIYALGEEMVRPGIDWQVVLHALDPMGTRLWTRTISFQGQDIRARGIAVDSSGNVFVVGMARSAALADQNIIGNDDVFIRRYDAAGTEAWTRQFGTVQNDDIASITVDNQGSRLIVCGNTLGAFPGSTSAGSWDAFVRWYDLSGNVLMTQQFGTSLDDVAADVRVTSTGVTVVVGSTWGTLGLNNAGARDIFIRRFGPSGTVLSTVQFGSTGIDSVVGLDLDANDAVFMTGTAGASLPAPVTGSGSGFILRRLP